MIVVSGGLRGVMERRTRAPIDSQAVVSPPAASASLALLRDKLRQLHDRVFVVSDELTDEQLRWRPAPKAHSIGFALWHTARADDNVQHDLLGAERIWVAGGYPARWGHPERGIGTGWDDERAAALPLPPKAELFEYAKRAFAAVDRATEGLDEMGLARPVESAFMGHASTAGEILLVCVTHDARHLGEMEYIKGLLGLRGTAST